MATYWVNSDAADDSGSGAELSPKKTLTAGLALLANGDTLRLRGNFYAQQLLTPNRTGIIIQNDDEYPVVIDGAGTLAANTLEINSAAPSGQIIKATSLGMLKVINRTASYSSLKLRSTTTITKLDLQQKAGGNDNVYVNSGNYTFTGNRLSGAQGAYSVLGFYNDSYGIFAQNIIENLDQLAGAGAVISCNSTHSVARTTNFYNNIIYGGGATASCQLITISNTANKTVNINNNVLGPLGLGNSYNGNIINGYGSTTVVNYKNNIFVLNLRNTAGNYTDLTLADVVSSYCIDGGGNIIDSAKFAACPYQGFLQLGMDDGAYVHIGNVATIAEKYGKRITWYCNKKNHGMNVDTVAANAAIVDLAARGHDIGCHTRSHSVMSDMRAATVKYTGGGGAANLTISGASFSVVVPGNTAHNFSYDMTGKTMANLAVALNNTGYYTMSYTEAPNGSGYYTLWIGPGTYNYQYAYAVATSLADVAVDISSSTTINFDRTRFYYHEVDETINWLNSYPGVDCVSGSTGYNSGDETYLAYARARYENHRLCTTNKTPSAYAVDLYRVESIDSYTPFGTVDQYDEAGLRKRARLLADDLCMVGGVLQMFWHDPTEMTTDALEIILEELTNKYPRLWIGSAKQFADYVRSNSEWVASGDAYNREFVDQSDYDTLPLSVARGAGVDVGLTEDDQGTAIPGTWGFDIGLRSAFKATDTGYGPWVPSTGTLTLTPIKHGDTATPVADINRVMNSTKELTSNQIDKYIKGKSV